MYIPGTTYETMSSDLKKHSPALEARSGPKGCGAERHKSSKSYEWCESPAVLEMVRTVRDRLAALVLDNTFRAACDDLRRQCHSQGVAFGDLSRLVKQSREDQEESRADTWDETRPHPRIRPELLDGGGNLRARDIGITLQDGDTFLHGVRITRQKDDMEDNRRRPATAAPYPPCPEELENARRQPAMSSRTPARRHVDARISTSGVYRDI